MRGSGGGIAELSPDQPAVDSLDRRLPASATARTRRPSPRR